MSLRRSPQNGQNGRRKGNPKGVAYHERLKEPFLEALRKRVFIGPAAEEVGIARNTVYEWKKNDPVFAAKMREVEEASVDVLRTEAFRRGVQGVPEPVYQGGRLVGTVQKYSDTLLVKMLQAKDPAYREKIAAQVNVTFVQRIGVMVSNIVNRFVALKCPHCNTVLPFREKVASALERLELEEQEMTPPA